MAESTSWPERRAALRSAAWCCFYGAGICGMLVVYGILQERIMSMPYGDPPVYFKDSMFLVVCTRAVAMAFAVGMVAVKGESYGNAAPFWKYLAISFTNVYASACQYEALKYVSFPVQMLGKSFKMMPVMIWGMVVSGKRFSITDWLVAMIVTGGVAVFLLGGPVSGPGPEDPGSSTSDGYRLLLLAVFLDGFTSTFQEKLFKEHTTSKYNQLLYINLGSTMISSATLVASGRIADAFGFAVGHPLLCWDAMTLSGAAVAGQWFIYSQVEEFGALVFAATMSVRQVASILVSYAKYGHSITALQIHGLVVIFAALLYKGFKGLRNSNDEKKPLLEKKSAIPHVSSAESLLQQKCVDAEKAFWSTALSKSECEKN